MSESQLSSGKSKQVSLHPLSLDVEVREPQHDCPLYAWDREHGRMRVTGIYHAKAGLSSDLAVLVVEGQAELLIRFVPHCFQ